ncbi:MAG: M3 family oligoendopeptidase [Hyphomicrobiales bacterium]
MAAATKAPTQGAGTLDALGDLPEWNLSDLYDSIGSDTILRDLEGVTAGAESFANSYRGALSGLAKNDPDGLLTAVRSFEEIQDKLGRIGSFAGLSYASNTTDPEIAKFYGDMNEKLTAISSNLLFFGLELNIIDDELIEAALTHSGLAHYRPWFEDLRLDKPYQLSEKIEELFHEKSITGRGAFNRLFDETMAGLRFDIDGEELALEQTLNKLVSPDGEIRKKAAAALGKVFKANIRLFTLITNTLSKDKEISDRWRGFEDVADSRHLANRVERDVVDALEKAVSDAYPRLSHRYYAMKAKWLGMKKLNHWDRNAPLPREDHSVISWDEARDTVLSAYGGFSHEMRDIAKDFFDKGWIDAPVREGKAPGAFSHPTVPSAHPYVLMNYQGKTRDVMTLAHELGHGVHQVLAGPQGALMAPTPLTLAETASVFGEMLTFRALLAQKENAAERKIMLASKVEDMLNTVVRQIAFYTFERRIHTARREGELTSDQINEIWMGVQRESLGDAVKFGEGYETFWAYIPHFIHSPFYVYAYAFGDCLVNSLYAVYEDAEEGFQEKYFELLKAGGTKHHSQLLAPFGLDASDPAFWQKGLSLLEGFIDELEALDAAST